MRTQNAPLPELNAYIGTFDCLPFNQPQSSSRHLGITSRHIATDHQRNSFTEPSKVRKAIMCLMQTILITSRILADAY